MQFVYLKVDETAKRVLVDHVASENLVDCLKNKREKEREYKEEYNARTSMCIFMMTCDKVNAKVKVNEDSSWRY